MHRNKYTELVRFNNTDASTKKTIILLEMVLAVVVAVIIIIYFLILAKVKILSQVHDLSTLVLYLSTFILYFVILFISCLLFHEIIHFIPLWLFSKKRPQFGFTYVILRPNTFISKTKALISYLLPFLVITVVFSVVLFFVNPILQAALVVMGLIHFPMCSHDLLFSFRLYKCRGANIKLAHEKRKKGIDTIFFTS
jgi:hypothetical protein